mmetsp:Transcript_6947/g.28278  ORF Transcript_6947/g.28278 Transcript_6947/m.28278 type:complete len:340 (-) Transcript_6947:50-1069(-)
MSAAVDLLLHHRVVHLDGGAHAGRDVHALPVDALGTRGAVGVDGVDNRLEVGHEVGVLEVGLAEGNVNDALLVGAELNLATLELTHGGGDVGGDGASLGVGHETLGTESATELGSLGHHVRGGDEKVKVHHATRDLLHEIVRTREVGTRRLGRGDVVARGEHGDANSLAGALGEGDGGAELLVVVLGVDVEADVALGGLGELGGGVGEHELDSLRRLDRVHAAGHRSLRLAEALGLPRLLGALAILASRAHGGGPFVRLVNTRRLLELGKVEPSREHTHALPAARTAHLDALGVQLNATELRGNATNSPHALGLHGHSGRHGHGTHRALRYGERVPRVM